MKQLQPPALVGDLYRDLRDRRLLVPAIALLIALVAVPVLLATDSPSAPPPAPPPPAEATAAQPAVLTESVGIRDYRERLEALKSKNPFKQKFALPTPESVALADQGTTPDSAAATATGAVDAATSSADAAGASLGAPAVEPTGPVSQPAPGTVKHTRKLLTRVVDVTLGPLGETTDYDNVKRTDVLPSREEPILAYFGASPNGKRAAFLIASTVVSSDGGGICSPSPESCSFVTMKPGHQRFLHYQPEGASEEVVYRFKLKRISEKVVKGSRQQL